jgi:hypothetical protein
MTSLKRRGALEESNSPRNKGYCLRQGKERNNSFLLLQGRPNVLTIPLRRRTPQKILLLSFTRGGVQKMIAKACYMPKKNSSINYWFYGKR